jgi:uncharacterized protein YyaL (SSP411 family)
MCFDLAADIVEYSLRDLLSTEGGFFSAEDADSAQVRGGKKSGMPLSNVYIDDSLTSYRGLILYLG